LGGNGFFKAEAGPARGLVPSAIANRSENSHP
jgi:hypothetical protein